jgi:hypothetical protein
MSVPVRLHCYLHTGKPASPSMVLCIMRASNCGELRPPVGVTGRNETGKVAPPCGTSFLLWVDTCPSGNSRGSRSGYTLVHSNRHRHRHRFSRPSGARFCSDKKAQGFTSAPSTFRHLGDWGASLLLSSFGLAAILTEGENAFLSSPFFHFFLSSMCYYASRRTVIN